jgi:small subunit ribosomal protein S21
MLSKSIKHSVVLGGGVVPSTILEQAMRVLKKKVLKEGIFRLAKEKSVYEKPSERKRRKKKEGIANFKKAQKKLRLQRGF